MAITISGGVSLSGGVNVRNGFQLIDTATLRFSAASSLSTTADGTNVTSLPNIGSGGSTYSASAAANYPTVATLSGAKVMQFDSSTKFGLSMAADFDASTNTSIFVVAYQTGVQRVVALGGGTGYANCFFGYGGQNGTYALFRDSNDGGTDASSLTSLAGLKVLGVVKNATAGTTTWYDNNTTPIAGGYVSTPYVFRRIGYRDAYGVQKSDGYIGDIVAFNRALSTTEISTVISSLKSLYSIA